ncbi:MAG: SIR2 family NAD-dependent protein deacylase, partial [Gammaproteobacteria bacterium]
MSTFLEIIKLVKASKQTVILTGAGISTESGLPDFRSNDGFWTKNKPIQFNEFLLSEEKQRLSWERNIELHSLLEKILPNKGHAFVEKITNMQKNNFLITQNIDGLHQKSGIPENKIIEIHGSAINAACLECDAKQNILDFHDAIK